MEKLKVISAFSGIGAFEKALKNIGVPFELVNYIEIDKWASKSYSVIHDVPESKNLWDITKVDETKLPDFDLFTYGFPCQDISIAGKQKGIGLDTRSGLLFDALRIIQHKLPKYAIAENVKNLVGKNHIENFKALLAELEFYGYCNYWAVLNAKDYGLPQNRERVFIVSIRQDIQIDFEFQKGFDNGLRLKDMLESEVDKKYYVSDEKASKLIEQLKDKEYSNTIRTSGRASVDRHSWDLVCVPCITPDKINKRQNGRRFKNDGEPMFTITAQDRHGVPIPRNEIIQVGKLENINGHDICKRIYSPDGISPTLPTGTSGNTTPKVLQDYRIRKLTPLECWRLQGFSDEDFHKAKSAGISDHQLYKQAGNSIAVTVLEAIFKQLFK